MDGFCWTVFYLLTHRVYWSSHHTKAVMLCSHLELLGCQVPTLAIPTLHFCIRTSPKCSDAGRCSFKVARCVAFPILKIVTSCIAATGSETSKTTFNNDQPRSGKQKDLWLETLWKKVNWLKWKSQYTGLLHRRTFKKLPINQLRNNKHQLTW